MTSPIAFFIFNRPSHTIISFDSIRKSRPDILFVIADGPRNAHMTDNDRCNESRIVTECIDWPCTVYRNYSDVNLGCRNRINSGLDWVFSIVDKAIILEDDCLPHPDFFNFCDNLLETYKDNYVVCSISGTNFQNGIRRSEHSYYFSKFIHIWGWATWKRAWEMHDKKIEFWPNMKNSITWKKYINDDIERSFWESIFDSMYMNRLDTWDYAWICSNWHAGNISITPNVNLVSNIGFDSDGTHTRNAKSKLANMQTHSMGKILHPNNLTINQEADAYYFNIVLGGRLLKWPLRILWVPYYGLRVKLSELKNFLLGYRRNS